MSDRIEVGIFEYGNVNLWCSACSRETGSGIFQRYTKPVDIRTLAVDVEAHQHDGPADEAAPFVFRADDGREWRSDYGPPA